MTILTYKDIVNSGIPGGSYFKELVEETNSFKSDNKEKLLEIAKKIYQEKYEIKTISLQDKSSLNVFLDVETDFEKNNKEQSVSSMATASLTPTVRGSVILPDACPSGREGTITVGGVIATENAIHPGMHSADICCSVMATNLGKVDPKVVLDKAYESTGFGPFARNNLYDLPDNLTNKFIQNPFLRSSSKLEKARYQLGTQGDGNHFYFVGISNLTGDTYIISHHGSRGVGADLYKEGMKIAQRFTEKHSPETLKINSWMEADSQKGQDYWEALQLVREWTKLNHTVVHNHVANLLYKNPLDRFWNEHNFVFKRNNLYYHAKGATPAWENFSADTDEANRTIIPLNMGQSILITKGLDNPLALGFAPHGAGRNMSRTAHKKLLEGKSTKEVYDEETQGLDIRFQAGDIDISELPSAYKSPKAIEEQLTRHKLATVYDKIMPYGSIMAGDIDLPWGKNR